jgi:hypothetical protein
MGDGPGFTQELAVGLGDNWALSVLNLASNGLGELVLPQGWSGDWRAAARPEGAAAAPRAGICWQLFYKSQYTIASGNLAPVWMSRNAREAALPKAPSGSRRTFA